MALAEKFSGLKGHFGSTLSGMDLKSFSASFLILSGLAAFYGYGILFGKESAPVQNYTGKIMAALDVSQQIDEPINHDLSQSEDMTASPLQAEDKQDSEQLPVPEPEQVITTEKIDGLFEDTEFGPVPIKRETDGLTVLKAYQIPFTPLAGTKGVIGIMMVDYGLSSSMTEESLNQLPKEISFTVSPYASGLQDKIDEARTAGHEIWLDMPIQSRGYGAANDTGPLTLLAGLNAQQNNNRLLKTLSRAYGYVGVTVGNIPDFSEDLNGLKDIFSTLSARGLALADVTPSNNSLSDLADLTSLPYKGNTMWIEAGSGDAAVKQSLEKLEKAAGTNYVAVAFIRPQPNLFPLLNDWAKTLPDKGLQLAPLTTVIEQSKLQTP